MRDELINLYNSLTGFDEHYPIAITYDYHRNELTYKQLAKVVTTSAISHLYLPKKFKLGIMTPGSYHSFMEELANIIKKGYCDNSLSAISINKLRTDFYVTFKGNPNLPGPQRVGRLDYVPIKTRFIAKYILKTYNSESRILWRLIKNENKLNSTSNGPINTSESTESKSSLRTS